MLVKKFWLCIKMNVWKEVKCNRHLSMDSVQQNFPISEEIMAPQVLRSGSNDTIESLNQRCDDS
jgi:hypothetical protein